MAGLIKDSENITPEGYSISQFLRIQFYKTNSVDGERSVQWLNTTMCNKFYENTTSSVIQNEFFAWDFVCADYQELTLLNQPYLY